MKNTFALFATAFTALALNAAAIELPFDRTCPNGPVIEAVDADQSISTGEFWRTMHALRDALPKSTASSATPVAVPQGLRVSDNHRFLATAEGKPFFCLPPKANSLQPRATQSRR